MYENLTLFRTRKRPDIPTLSRTSPSILEPGLGQALLNGGNCATLPCLGQIQSLFRTDSPKIIYPFRGREAHNAYPVQRHIPEKVTRGRVPPPHPHRRRSMLKALSRSGRRAVDRKNARSVLRDCCSKLFT